MALQNAPQPLYQKQGRVWLQRTELYPYFLLHNHGLTSISWPASAQTAIRGQSNLQRTGSNVVDITDGDAELPTFTIPTRLAEIRNYLQSIVGEYVHVQLLTGADGNPTQYGAAKKGLGWVLCRRGPGTSDTGALVDNAGEGAPVSMEAPFTGVLGPLPIDWGVSLESMTFAEPNPGRDVFTLPPLVSDEPARRVLPGEVGMIVCDSAVGPDLAGIYYFQDGLRTAPTAVTTDPFAAGDDATGVVGYGDKRESRFIVGSETAAAPTISYTDDYGVTWTNVAIGAVAGDIPYKLWLVDASRIYAVGGQAGSSKIWMSRDGGATWTETDPGLAQPINDICVMGNGMGYVVGDANTVAGCTDWDNWAAITGPAGGAGDALLTVGVKASTGTVFVGTDSGELFVTQTDGDDWVAAGVDQSASIQGYTATSIDHIRFDMSGEYGFMTITTAVAVVVLRTTDGGDSWRIYSLGNAGFANVAKNGIDVFGPNNVLLTGAVGVTATLLKAETNFDGGRQY